MSKLYFVVSIVTVILSSLPVYSVADNSIMLANNRKLIFDALNQQQLLHKDRQLVRLVHLCNLIIDNKHYPVIDIKEHVKGAQVPKGIPHIVILDSSLKVTKKIFNSGPTIPLYCKDNQLFLHGYIDIDGGPSEGNVLTFSEGGLQFVVSAMEPNDFPVQDTPQ